MKKKKALATLNVREKRVLLTYQFFFYILWDNVPAYLTNKKVRPLNPIQA